MFCFAFQVWTCFCFSGGLTTNFVILVVVALCLCSITFSKLMLFNHTGIPDQHFVISFRKTLLSFDASASYTFHNPIIRVTVSLFHFQSSLLTLFEIMHHEFSVCFVSSGNEFKEVLLLKQRSYRVSFRFSVFAGASSTGTTLTFNLSFRPFSLGPNLRPASHHHIPVSAFA
jgi:hypothetical protein